jgi:KDO2-lipid IV(A) lauroyltransferase
VITWRARLLFAIGEAIGRIAFWLRLRRRVALEGLRRAFPERTEAERRAIAYAAYRQLGRSLAELIAWRNLSDAELKSVVDFVDWDRYEAARAGGRGVIMVVTHFGNWELAARAAVRRGMELTTITRTLRGPVNERLLAYRRNRGMRELPEKGSSGDALRVLRRGESLGLVIDQNMLASRGIFVDFFGTPACTTPAPAILALRTGAPLLLVFDFRAGDGTHRIRFDGPFSVSAGPTAHARVAALTQELTRAVENTVREHPEYWFWVHRRWKTRPAAEATLPPRDNP